MTCQDNNIFVLRITPIRIFDQRWLCRVVSQRHDIEPMGVCKWSGHMELQMSTLPYGLYVKCNYSCIVRIACIAYWLPSIVEVFALLRSGETLTISAITGSLKMPVFRDVFAVLALFSFDSIFWMTNLHDIYRKKNRCGWSSPTYGVRCKLFSKMRTRAFAFFHQLRKQSTALIEGRWPKALIFQINLLEAIIGCQVA